LRVDFGSENNTAYWADQQRYIDVAGTARFAVIPSPSLCRRDAAQTDRTEVAGWYVRCLGRNYHLRFTYLLK